jgi:hypothetical protein
MTAKAASHPRQQNPEAAPAASVSPQWRQASVAAHAASSDRT